MSTAIVTGAANGIGRATAERLVADGFVVAGLDIEPIDVPGVHGTRCDISEIERFGEIVESIERELGPVEALANVAGVSLPQTLDELTVEGYRRQLSITLDGPIFLARAVGLRMAERRSGRIVNVTSVHAHASEAASLAYGASKAGLMAATRVMAIELGPHGVLVNDVAPGFVRTRMSIKDGESELDGEWFDGHLPQVRKAAAASSGRTRGDRSGDLAPAVAGEHVHHGDERPGGRRAHGDVLGACALRVAIRCSRSCSSLFALLTILPWCSPAALCSSVRVLLRVVSACDLAGDRAKRAKNRLMASRRVAIRIVW